VAGGAKDLDYRYRKNRERLKREAPAICGICGGDIDLELPPRDPGSWSADHIVPLNNGGDPYDYFNLQPAHFGCNSRKQDRTFVKPKASRRWLAESLLLGLACSSFVVLLDFCCFRCLTSVVAQVVCSSKFLLVALLAASLSIFDASTSVVSQRCCCLLASMLSC
jgi:hypothetical protein